MSIRRIAESMLGEFRSRSMPRAGSLIVTVFGDAIAPRGGSVWVGSLIRVMQAFGISERLVRTSVFRLSRDGWLESEQIGRRSFYGLTAEGAEKFEQATHRIYGAPRLDWSGDWCLILLSGLEASRREPVRKELSWLGFGSISTTLVAHPAPDTDDLNALLARLEVSNEVVVMQGQTLDPSQDQAMRGLAQSSWNLADVDSRYRSFVSRFRPIDAALGKSSALSAEHAFQIRTLLIQEYRKILLRDPLLPPQMLPQGWHGKAAYQLCRDIYRRIYDSADCFLTDTMETSDGPLPPPSAEFFTRFGGLK